MKALAELGHQIGFVSLHELEPRSLAGANVQETFCLKQLPSPSTNGHIIQLSKSQERFRSYWGIEKTHIQTIGKIADEFHADAVIVVGLNVLPYLGAVRAAVKVWYAADEWAWHHLSQVRMLAPSSWKEIEQALVKGLYERAYAPMLDRVWMVSSADERAIRWVAGARTVDVLPNGVDTEHFQPLQKPEIPHSCVFWGRLDFGPNIQALQWFCRKVWPAIIKVIPGATLTIYGFQPTATVFALGNSVRGIKVIPNLPDLRERIAEHQVVVLPFVSGGGIKNKLLEAAAMGRPILCSTRTDRELSAGSALVRAGKQKQWRDELIKLWRDEARRKQLGSAAREWVMCDHTWKAVADKAVCGLKESLQVSEPL
jgi:glycosyltransferase involved in cell wall biosynthesis